jgi:hypothetical protein
MAHHNSNNVHGDGISQQHTKGEHDPRQVGGIECKESQKAHFDVFVSSSPYINHHECESASQKVHMRVNGNQRNASNSKQEHHDIVGRSAAEVPFFQQSTVPDLSVRMDNILHITYSIVSECEFPVSVAAFPSWHILFYSSKKCNSLTKKYI